MTFAQRHSRLVVLTAAVLVLGAFLAILTTWMTPASAFMCDPDTTFTLPVEPNRDTGATVSTSTQTFESEGDAWTVVSDSMLPVDAYGGSGYDWYPFAAKWCSPMSSVFSMVGDILLVIFVTAPATWLGAVTQFAFSTTLVNALLPFMGESMGDLERGVFQTWAPMMIAAVLITVIFSVARGRGQKGFGDLGWMVAVILIMGMLASPVGIQLLEKVNQVTRNITTNAMYAGTTGGSTGDNANSMTVGMVDSLSFDTWAVGAVGDLARSPIPTEISFGERKNPFMVNTNRTVKVPVNIIPAVNPGAPTWAEAMRWTQTYTWSEMAAMESNSALRCSVTESQNMGHLSEGNPIDGSDSREELCGYKWLLRGAMFSHLVDHHPSAYASAAGNMDRIAVSLTSSLSVLPLTILLLVIGFMVLLYQLQMLMFFLSSPVVALLALKSKTVGRRWLEKVLGALVKWISAGFVMGLVLMVLGWSAQVTNDITATINVTAIAMLFVRGLITWLLVIAAFVMFSKIQGMILSGVDLKPEESGKGKRALGTAALVVGGAAMGVAGAGAGAATGVRAKAAMAGASRGVLGRYGASAQLALGRAQRAGQSTREKAEGAPDEDLDEGLDGPEPQTGRGAKKPDKPGGGSGGGAAESTDNAGGRPNIDRTIPPVPAGMEGREDVTEAWAELMGQPDIQKSLEVTGKEEEFVTELIERSELARDSADDAERDHERILRAKMLAAKASARTKVANGMDPQEAEEELLGQVLNDPEVRAHEESASRRRAEADELEAAVRKAMPNKVGELVEAMNSKEPEVLQAELGLSEETMEKMARYRHAAQNATYESLPDLDGSKAPAEAVARYRDAAAARGESPASQTAPSDLVSQTLARARSMSQGNQTVVHETVLQEASGTDRMVRSAIRAGVREGLQDAGKGTPTVQAPPPPPKRRSDTD